MTEPPPPLRTVKLSPEQLRIKEEMDRRSRMGRALGRIRHKIIVMSGKGGVGKSTVAVNLAASLAQRGFATGILDMDLTGPDVPLMLGVEGQQLPPSLNLIVPFETKSPPLKVLSIGFLLKDNPVVWRGPLKTHALTQFLGDVAWGDLDFLVVDLPPGTSDEPLAVAENIPDADGCVIVTTPQGVATLDVKKSIQFARLMHLKVLGLLENMSGLDCPHCGGHIDLFGHGGGEALAEAEKVRFLGAIPLDPELVDLADTGRPFVAAKPESAAARAFEKAVDGLLEAVSEPSRAPGQ